MTMVVLVRHGETDWNKEQIFRGRTDIPLNANGIEQARQTARALHNLPVSAVFSSPLMRAVMTASEIASVFGLAVQKDDAFTDIDFGRWERQPLQVVQAAYPQEYRRFLTEPHRWAVEGGETLAAVQERAWNRLNMLVRSRESQTIVVVTHRVVLKVLILAALGMELSRFWNLQQDTCTINIFSRQENGGFTMHRFNESCHLFPLHTGLLKKDF